MAEQALAVALKGAPELQAAIDEILKSTDDLTPAWERFYRPAFHEAMGQTFSTRQSGTWRPHDRRYAAWKARHGGGEMMVLSGALKRSLTARTGESVYEPRPRDMTIGSTTLPTNTPRGRMLIWADSTAMRFHVRNAAERHAQWYAEKWGKR